MQNKQDSAGRAAGGLALYMIALMIIAFAMCLIGTGCHLKGYERSYTFGVEDQRGYRADVGIFITPVRSAK